ncbi:hypothetical protein [Legionella waltersii]|uniref:Silver efflux pump n=1 Tax=Legionella waltersii TaxID=66969 RepID=A0A0W1ABT9_9GAMM|nr:hypothetical protein [Legionella waltersii]KTD78830.1 silver efflux pump [Legionella waltersii]SNV10923.1 silver efflux pump [Legionella waltersii]
MNTKKTASALVTAAALAFTTAPITSSLVYADDANSVACYGSNACKGQSACKTANNACKGQNSCKGKGMTMVDSEKTCTDAGGTTTESKS